MTDQAPSSTPLTDQAIARLRKLAHGNGLAPDALRLMGTEESVYTVKGTTRLVPFAEKQGARNAGPAASGKNKNILSSFADLRTQTDQAVKSFRERTDWVPMAIEQLKAQPNFGWGLHDVRISLPECSVAMAANEPCPTCRGQKVIPCQPCHAQGHVICAQCHGNRYEPCYNCHGQGFYQGDHNQPCQVCVNGMIVNGFRCLPCRQCQGTGQMVCPTCQGRRGTPCTTCKATGIINEDIVINCGADANFFISAEGLPSGLRRGLDRLGLVKVGDGHADISLIAPPPPTVENVSSEPYTPYVSHSAESAENAKTAVIPEQNYEARLPFADMRMDFAGKKALVSVFGKRGIMLNVPPFLDTAAETARDALRAAAKGKASIDAALSMRMMQEALGLQLKGKYDAKELRRLYPYGLTPQTAQAIMQEMRNALKRFTRTIRGGVTALCCFVSGGLFAGYFMTSTRGAVVSQFPKGLAPLADFILLFATLGLSWLALSLSSRIALQRRFPTMPVSRLQTTGNTGYVMIAVIVGLFAAIIGMAAIKPEWLSILLAK